jgi:hypothetical protein
MNRREFLVASAGLTALSLVPDFVKANKLIATGSAFTLEPYKDNKVVRVYDPAVSDFNFTEDGVYWKTINQDVLSKMLSKSLFEISGEKKEAKAWKIILAGNKKAQLADKKVAIKVNFNNTGKNIYKTLNNSPAMLIVLAKSLTESGLQQKNISFFDCSRPFPAEIKKIVNDANLPEVVMVGKNDNLKVSDKTIFLSDLKGVLRDGKPTDQYPIPQCLIDADYLVNLHLVKMHSPGVTGAMKNLFGLASNVWFHMHQKGPVSFSDGTYMADISLNEDIQKRARLNIAEFIFGGHSPDTVDKFENEAFFPNGRPSSLVVSRSPFYHDTILYGFVKAEYEAANPEHLRKDMNKLGTDKWLVNAAAAYSGWKLDHATFVEGKGSGFPKMDLKSKSINYITI